MEHPRFEQPEKMPRRITEIEQFEEGMRIVFCNRLTGERVRAEVKNLFEDDEVAGRYYLVVRYLSGEHEGSVEQVELEEWNVPEPALSGGYSGEGWIELDVNQDLSVERDQNLSAEFAMPNDRPRNYQQYEDTYNKRPKLKKGQITSPADIAVGDTIDLMYIYSLFPKFSVVKIIEEPKKDESGGYRVKVINNDNTEKILNLADYGVVPYGNGEWERGRYMKKSKNRKES